MALAAVYSETDVRFFLEVLYVLMRPIFWEAPGFNRFIDPDAPKERLIYILRDEKPRDAEPEQGYHHGRFRQHHNDSGRAPA